MPGGAPASRAGEDGQVETVGELLEGGRPVAAGVGGKLGLPGGDQMRIEVFLAAARAVEVSEEPVRPATDGDIRDHRRSALRDLDGSGLDPVGRADYVGDGFVEVRGLAAAVEDADGLVEVIADPGELGGGGHQFFDQAALVDEPTGGAVLGAGDRDCGVGEEPGGRQPDGGGSLLDGVKFVGGEADAAHLVALGALAQAGTWFTAWGA
jgi:hypothetical protein